MGYHSGDYYYFITKLDSSLGTDYDGEWFLEEDKPDYGAP